jgi:hypothetical protein
MSGKGIGELFRELSGEATPYRLLELGSGAEALLVCSLTYGQ